MTRRICVITGSRADYGHLAPVMQAIAADPALRLQVIVCGAHLDRRFGDTWKTIKADGFVIDAKVQAPLDDDSNLATAAVTGATVTGVARELDRLKPDIVVLLGDRYEILAAGVAALLMKVPIAHIHGGEVTEGAFDDAMRHALSKMASLHFAAAAPYKARLVQMGEDPERVIVTGAPGLDDVDTIKPADDAALAALGLTPAEPLLLVTYHPVTLEGDSGKTALDHLLAAVAVYTDAAMVFTGVNSDPGHAVLKDTIAAFVAKDPKHRIAVDSLGRQRYLAVMKRAAAVIGNSSSGLIEAPALGVPTINVGDRQKGRLRAPSVIDCGSTESAIRAALLRALDPVFRAAAKHQRPPYGGGGAALRIVAALKDVSLMQLSTKRFHDIILSP
jgi:UDP-hydrolysing UDP-N-acetyl-D-glucosamine 2-epimerase